LRAMGDSPVALETFGLSVNVTKVLVYCMSAFIAAISGALTASLYTFAIGSNFPSFSSLTLVALVTVVVIGDPWYAFVAAAAVGLIPLYVAGDNVASFIVAFFGLGAVLMPAFRDKITGTPEVIRRFVDRLGGTSGPVEHTRRAPTTPPARRDEPVAARAGSGLIVEHLTVRYGGVVAVDDAGLRAPLGTITGLIGPNGAGKTTIFNACSGLLRPTRGRIALRGADITRASTSQRARQGLGRTFQRVQLFESLDVHTNIALARECLIAGRNAYRQIVPSRGDARSIDGASADAIMLTGTEALIDTPVKNLTTGQRRLVELARVLAGGFDLVLLDEPSSGLDQSETERFGEVLRRVADDRGLGILLVEHDMALVQQICEHVYVLDFGRMLFEGSVEEMVASDVVRAAYLGTDTIEPVSELVSDSVL